MRLRIGPRYLLTVPIALIWGTAALAVDRTDPVGAVGADLRPLADADCVPQPVCPAPFGSVPNGLAHAGGGRFWMTDHDRAMIYFLDLSDLQNRVDRPLDADQLARLSEVLQQLGETLAGHGDILEDKPAQGEAGKRDACPTLPLAA